MLNSLFGLEHDIALFIFKEKVVKFSNLKDKFLLYKITVYKIRTAINNLQSKKIIEKSGNGKGTIYMINRNDIAGKHAYMQLLKSLEIDLKNN